MNIEKSIKRFNAYVNDYDTSNGSIQLKIIHTNKVMMLSNQIAKGLNLSQEDIQLATLIGLLHDIGRFDEIKLCSHMGLGNFNHATHGVKLLFEENLIRDFIEDDKFDDIIKFAIDNHSKYQIKSTSDKRMLLHAKIIRDADKLDIYRVKLEGDFASIQKGLTEKKLKTSCISDEIMIAINNHQSINRSIVKTYLDEWLLGIAMVFDINFPISFKILKDNNYIDKILNRVDYTNSTTKENINQIQTIVNNYIDININKN